MTSQNRRQCATHYEQIMLMNADKNKLCQDAVPTLFAVSKRIAELLIVVFQSEYMYTVLIFTIVYYI